MPDVIITDHGTIVTFDLVTEAAEQFAATYVDVPDYMSRHGSFAADHRIAAASIFDRIGEVV
jgi:hypothetical protein